MALVGDAIQLARDLMQDQAQSLGQPMCTLASTSGSLGAGTYYVIVTQWTPWGESIGSTEQSINLSLGGGIAITSPLLPGAVKVRAYLGTTSGGENQWQESAIGSGTLTIAALSTSGGAPPPTTSAWLPDTDGSYLRAAPVFRWLSEGLRVGSRIAGGLPDYSGFPSVINFATYIIQGEWTRQIDAWYDGYPVSFAQPVEFFKRNGVAASILGGWSLSFWNDQMGVEVWPQPARTATQTTLAAPMLATDTTATLTSTAGFLLPTYGMVRFGTEICLYNGINGNQLVGLIRGVGGTVASAWASGTQVNELNAYFRGRRVYTNIYVPGQSNLPLHIPAGWPSFLADYIYSKFLVTERDSQGADAYMKQFTGAIKDWARTNRQVSGPQQVGNRDNQFTVFGGTRFGGNVIP